MGRENLSDEALWQRIDACDLAGLGEGAFFAKLIKENRWQRRTAQAAIREYKKFMYLTARSSHRLSPPPAVDRVWHIHLLFSRHYFETFCPEILGKTVHHEPSPNSADARKRDKADGRLAQDLYKEEFGRKPPRAIWQRGALAKLPPVLGLASFGALVLAIFGVVPFTLVIGLFAATIVSGLLFGGPSSFSLEFGGGDGDLFQDTSCGSCGSGSGGCGDGCGGCGD